jgi:hypothetical protein
VTFFYFCRQKYTLGNSKSRRATFLLAFAKPQPPYSPVG